MPIKCARVVAMLLACAAVVGCASAGTGGDKAGGRSGGGPLVLRLANTSFSLTDVPPVEYFVRRVEQLSRGAIRIQVISAWADWAPDAEVQVARAVASGRVDLGWAGSRVFDSIGVSSFRALSAPMLIDSYPLEKAVLTSALPTQMLAALKRVGVIGLGVLGEELRLPISVQRPLLAPSDWRGVGFGTYRSGVQEEAIRALGAVPVEAFAVYRNEYLKSGRIQAFELDLRRYLTDLGVTKAPYVAANVHLWPQFDVLFANPSRLRSLSDQQRAWLKHAAADAAGRSVALADDSARYIKQACLMGARFENATGADLTAMRRTLSAVYQQLEQNPRTDAFIREIETLKLATPPGLPFLVPSGCSRQS